MRGVFARNVILCCAIVALAAGCQTKRPMTGSSTGASEYGALGPSGYAPGGAGVGGLGGAGGLAGGAAPGGVVLGPNGEILGGTPGGNVVIGPDGRAYDLGGGAGGLGGVGGLGAGGLGTPGTIVLGPDGQPILGPDGRPLVYGPDGRPMSPGGAGLAGGPGAGGAGAFNFPGDDGSANYFAVNVGDRVYFAYDSSELDERAREVLQRQAAWLKLHPSVSIVMEGHCDERGTREYNIALGNRRANAAKSYLASLGVDPGRVEPVSYGKERPVQDCPSESCWGQNRRAVSVVRGGGA